MKWPEANAKKFQKDGIDHDAAWPNPVAGEEPDMTFVVLNIKFAVYVDVAAGFGVNNGADHRGIGAVLRQRTGYTQQPAAIMFQATIFVDKNNHPHQLKQCEGQ